jgi:3-hydroxyacyl-CoA dehydrogenase
MTTSKVVDLQIEAVFESMEVKEKVFTTLDAVCKPGAIPRPKYISLKS